MGAEGAPPPAPVREPLALRLSHTVLVVATLVLCWWVVGVAALHAPLYEQLELKSFPFLTELFLKMSGIGPAALIAGGLAGLALAVAGHFGFIDRMLLPLIIAELVLDAFLVYGWLVALPLPLRQIQEKLTH